MALQNLWKKIPEIKLTRTPYNILLEQANWLREITQGLLIAEVE